jgi:anaerobic selenocysteine-containing dehydrogenase
MSTDAVAPGVLCSPKGSWLDSSASGQTVNTLINAELKTNISEGACYNETFVDVRRLPQ